MVIFRYTPALILLRNYNKLLGNYPDDSANIDGEKLVLRPYETMSLEA